MAPTAGSTLRDSIEKARNSGAFRHYEHVRDLVLGMMDDAAGYASSTYWQQELEGFDYLFDASPLVIAKLREHGYHLTGLRPYEYREHHADYARRFASKLRRLKDVDPIGLFVPESRDWAAAGSGRHRVLEIGAGYGGFAYQLKTLLPDITYTIVDLPPTLLFSATYLKATFPDARMRFYSEGANDALFDDLNRIDFLFLPAHAFSRLPIPEAELAVNLASFQEMTTGQVTEYVRKLADSGCRQLYSLNRDRSRYNPELSTVTEIIETRYRVERLEVLDVPYTVLGSKPAKEPEAADYRHLIGRL